MQYRSLSDIPPTVETSPPSEDTSTEGGMLRYENHDLKTQIALAHQQIDLLAATVGIEVPRKNCQGFKYTPAGRMELVRHEVQRRYSEFLLSR